MVQSLYSPCFESLRDMLEKQSAKYPDKIVFTEFGDDGQEAVSITYAQLAKSSRSIAASLIQFSPPGSRCLILQSPGINFIKALFACFYAGIIAIPSYPPRPNKKNERFWSIVKNAEPHLVLLDQKGTAAYRNTINKAMIGKPAPKEVLIDSICGTANEFAFPATDPSDIALLQYTSGTTEEPLGTMISHQNILYNSAVIKTAFVHDDSLIGVNWLPPYHDMGLIGTIIQPIYVGGSNILIAPGDFLRNPAIWPKAITFYKGTTAGCPNFALNFLCDRISEEQKKDIDLSSLKVFFCGSEQIHPASVIRFEKYFSSCGYRKGTFLPCYGLAENTLMVSGIQQSNGPTFLEIDRHSLEMLNLVSVKSQEGKSITLTNCGRTFLDDKIKIVEPVTGMPLPEGQVGEIWISSPANCLGYYRNPSKTQWLFSFIDTAEHNKYMRTGDMGFLHNSQLFITGREKELIKIRGKNHYPNDIERSANTCHKALQPNACAAFQVQVNHSEKVIIFQEVKRTAVREVDPEKIVEAIRLAVSSEHEISVYAVVLFSPGRIPRTSSGKIQHSKCRSMWIKDSLSPIHMSLNEKPSDEPIITNMGSDPDITQIQEWLVSWLAKKINIDPSSIDPQIPILSYGLDSMGAVELEREVKAQFGIEIHPGDFMENNSIESLVQKGLIGLSEYNKNSDDQYSTAI